MGFSNERMRTGQLVNWFLLDGLELTPAGYPVTQALSLPFGVDHLIGFNELLTCKHPKTYQYLISSHTNTQWGKSELKTIWLTSSGYNAYDNGDWGYKVAYSRKALTICSTIKSRQQVERKGTNW